MIDLLNAMGLFKGEAVEVLRPVEDELDDMGEPTILWESETVENVLCAPSTTEDLEATRPDGVKVSVTFHFPKTYKKSLRGCKVLYNQNEYRIIGNPIPYMEQNTPGQWNYPALAEVVYG